MMRSGTMLLLAGLLLQPATARATGLDPESCARLEVEQGAMEKAGVRNTLAKGAQWAKGNLTNDQLAQVRRLIQVDEQIQFRCHGKPLVLLPSSVDADPTPAATDDDKEDGGQPKVAPGVSTGAVNAAPETKAAPKKAAIQPTPAPKAPAPAVKAPAAPGTAQPKAPAAAKAQPQPQPAPQGQAKAAAPKAQPAAKSPAADTAKSAEAAKKAPPAPKKKVDDAYKPPKADPDQNPFGFQSPN